MSFRFSIDRGGTFTDVYAECPNGEVEVLKLLSEDPAYKDAPTEAIRRILQKVSHGAKIYTIAGQHLLNYHPSFLFRYLERLVRSRVYLPTIENGVPWVNML